MTTHEYPYSPDEFPHQPPYPLPHQPPYPPYPPPQYPQPVDAYGRPFSERSRVTAGLLGIFFGCLGLGRFYLGYVGVGVAQVAVTWLTCGIGGIWPLIDAVMILTGKVPDAHGRVLRD
jgi:hypothetical protein